MTFNSDETAGLQQTARWEKGLRLLSRAAASYTAFPLLRTLRHHPTITVSQYIDFAANYKEFEIGLRCGFLETPSALQHSVDGTEYTMQDRDVVMINARGFFGPTIDYAQVRMGDSQPCLHARRTAPRDGLSCSRISTHVAALSHIGQPLDACDRHPP